MNWDVGRPIFHVEANPGMLSFGKTTEYALLAVMYLRESEPGSASARQIAEAYNLPQPLLGKILKSLHHNGLVESTRGSKGGYRLAVDLRDVSLERLMQAVRRPERVDRRVCLPTDRRPSDAPLLALRAKLRSFLRDVRLSDLVVPGRRIDLTVEMVGRTAPTRPPREPVGVFA